jgi:AraC-like DNA-binding protein
LDKNDAFLQALCQDRARVTKPNRWLERIAPQLNELWRGPWHGGTVEPGRYLHDHELVVISEGNCRVQIDAAVHELEAGSFLIVPPGRYHVTTAARGGVHRYCVHFDWIPSVGGNSRRPSWVYHPHRPRPADVKRPPGFVPQPIFVGRFDFPGPVPSLLETLFHGWQTGHELDRAVCRQIFGQVLVRLLWRRTRHVPSLDRATGLAYAVKELLDKSADRDILVQTLLPSLGFSYAHLGRLFKKKFGISPLGYRNAARLERAKNLLQDPKRTIAAAAYESGFKDPAYFSRQFRHAHGLAPKYSRS